MSWRGRFEEPDMSWRGRFEESDMSWRGRFEEPCYGSHAIDPMYHSMKM